MLIQLKRTTCLIVTLLTIAVAAKAQSAVLVMLKSERSRIEHLEKSGQKDNANILKKESQKIMQATLNDFTDNYRRTPVYFFVDTNLQKVINKKFDGVILNNELKPVDFRAWEKRDDYLIVYFGIPQTEITREGNGDKEQNVHRAVSYPNNGIVILNHEFKRRKGIHYIYLRYKGRRIMRTRALYNFESSNFSLSYYEMGNELQKALARKGVRLPVD